MNQHAFIICVLGILYIATGGAAQLQKLIVDSDGGGDDGVAILQMTEAVTAGIAQLVAITCSYGNTNLPQACDNIRRTLNLAAQADSVPVYKGCDSPLLSEPVYDNYYGEDGFGNAASEFPLPDQEAKLQHASIAIVELVNQYPGEITFVELGPLTNLAVAYKLDPTLPSKLKQLTIMGGTRQAVGNVKPVSEFNIYDDPEAAKIVLEKFKSIITMMPFENCIDYTASWEWYDAWVAADTSYANFVEKINAVAVQSMRDSNDTFQCCDLQASTVVLYPAIVTSSALKDVQVETCGELTRGETVVDNREQSDNDPAANVLIYTALDLQAMLDQWQGIVNDDSATTSVASDQ